MTFFWGKHPLTRGQTRCIHTRAAIPFFHSVFLPGKTLGTLIALFFLCLLHILHFFLRVPEILQPQHALKGCTREDAQAAAQMWRCPADRISRQALPWDEQGHCKPQCSPVHEELPGWWHCQDKGHWRFSLPGALTAPLTSAQMLGKLLGALQQGSALKAAECWHFWHWAALPGSCSANHFSLN